MIYKGTYAVSKCYPKWRVERRWDNFFMSNDGWKYGIYKELKGEVRITRILNSAQDALKKHGDFFIHHHHYSYIRIHGSTMEPYQLSRYVSNRLVMMEMMGQLAFLHEHFWHKKSTTTNLPVIVGEYQ